MWFMCTSWYLYSILQSQQSVYCLLNTEESDCNFSVNKGSAVGILLCTYKKISLPNSSKINFVVMECYSVWEYDTENQTEKTE